MKTLWYLFQPNGNKDLLPSRYYRKLTGRSLERLESEGARSASCVSALGSRRCGQVHARSVGKPDLIGHRRLTAMQGGKKKKKSS